MDEPVEESIPAWIYPDVPENPKFHTHTQVVYVRRDDTDEPERQFIRIVNVRHPA